MKYYLIKEDRATDFSNNREFVRWMRTNSKLYFETNKEFMEAYSYEQYFEDETVLRYENERDFVKDLISAGLLKREGRTSDWENMKEKIRMQIKKIFSNLLVNEV